MKPEHQKREMSSQEIERHLKSAVDALAPDIFDRLDLSVPQQKPEQDSGPGQNRKFAAAHARHGCGGSGLSLSGNSRGRRLALPVPEPPDRFRDRH